jgi:hypothetical protein
LPKPRISPQKTLGDAVNKNTRNWLCGGQTPSKSIGSGSYHFAYAVSCRRDANLLDLKVYLLVLLFDSASPAAGGDSDVGVDLQIDAAVA